MASKKVYVVKSGTLHPTTNTYWLTPYYFTSKKSALASVDNILVVNKAIDIEKKEVFGHKDIVEIDYVGEGGKYKARIIVEWDYLN